MMRKILLEVAMTPEGAGQLGLGLITREVINKRKFILFDAKSSAQAIYDLMKSGEDLSEDEIVTAFEKTVVGYIDCEMPHKSTGEQWGAWTVKASAAEKGFGPLMYDIAMMSCGKITSDRMSVSPRALAIWKNYFNNRGDVQHHKFDDIKNPQTPPKEDDARIQEKHEVLNYAYSGAVVNLAPLEKNTDKFKNWLRKNGLDTQYFEKMLSQGGGGLFRRKYLHED